MGVESILTIGILIGALIGMVTSCVFQHLLKLLRRASTWNDSLKIMGELFSLTSFWFGGPWLAGKMLVNINWDKEVIPYSLSLLVVFVIFNSWPMFNYIRGMASDIATG
jgi:hypothetical protein